MRVTAPDQVGTVENRHEAAVSSDEILLYLQERSVGSGTEEFGVHIIGDRHLSQVMIQGLLDDPARDDPDHPPSVHHRHGVDVVPGQQLPGLGDGGYRPAWSSPART